MKKFLIDSEIKLAKQAGNKAYEAAIAYTHDVDVALVLNKLEKCVLVANEQMKPHLKSQEQKTNEKIKSKANPDNLPDKKQRLFKRTIIPDDYKNENIILFGESGFGKTTAAIEYGREQFEKKKRIVLFFNCENETQFENEYKKIVNINLGLTNIENINLRESITQIKQKFIEISEKCEIIFIFDNLADYKTIETFITELLNVEQIQIIITTRFKLYQNIVKYSDNYKVIELKPFTSEEALKYINDDLKQTPSIDHTIEDIKELVQVLGNNEQCKPFIINHALDIILDIEKTRFKTINDLTQIIKNDKNTWSHGFYDLVSTHNDAIKRMLQYFIYLDNKSIHIEVLSKLMDESYDHLKLSVDKLVKNSVIKFKSLFVFEIHSLTIKDLEGYVKFKDNEKLELEKKLINVLNDSFPFYEKGPEYLQDKYYNHVEAFLSSSHSTNEVNLANMNSKLGAYYQMTYNLTKALKYHNESLKMRRAIYGNMNHPEIASSLNNIGSVYYFKNEYDEALKYHNESLEMRRAIYGTTNQSDIASSLNNIGSVYYFKNEYDEALKYHNESLKMRRAIYGTTNHPDIANSLNNIGLVYYSENEYDEALKYHKESFEMRRTIYGSINHSDIADSLNNIGSVYYFKNEYDEALKYYNKSLDMRRTIYGTTNHPDIAKTLNSIGVVYKYKNDFDESLKYHNESLEMRRDIYVNMNHSDIADSLYSIGLVYYSKNDYDQALKYFKESLEIRRTICGTTNHPDIAKTLNSIGVVYKYKNDFDESLK
jgi:tetratricopeptide (TPR) repeat protein